MDKVNTKKRIIELLKEKPMTRRMLATELGYPDQTFMVTQDIEDLRELGKVFEIGKKRCKRSKPDKDNIAMYLTSDPNKRICEPSNQLSLPL